MQTELTNGKPAWLRLIPLVQIHGSRGYPRCREGGHTVWHQEQGVRVDIDSVDCVATRELHGAARMWNQTLRCVKQRIWRLLEIGDSR